MSTTDYLLNTAAFPEEYAERLIDILAINPNRFLSFKDALYHFRRLDDDQAAEVMQQIVKQLETQEADGRPIVSAPALLASLEAILPYAESEAYSLANHKDSPECEAEAEHAWKAVEVAQGVIAQAKAAGILPASTDIDIHALLTQRRQIASVWSIEDVKELRPDLDDDQAWEVLQAAEDSHEGDIGINCSVLECHAEMLFGSAPETAEPAEA